MSSIREKLARVLVRRYSSSSGRTVDEIMASGMGERCREDADEILAALPLTESQIEGLASGNMAVVSMATKAS